MSARCTPRVGPDVQLLLIQVSVLLNWYGFLCAWRVDMPNPFLHFTRVNCLFYH